MLWREIIEKSAAFLAQRNVPDARVASELIVAQQLRVGRGLLASCVEKQAEEPQLVPIRQALKRLMGGEPIQYVLGEWDFRSLTLKCDRRALIPRPETEELVTRVLAFLNVRESAEAPVVVDVGTGTGAIILSLAREFRKEAVYLGTDVSEAAVQLARENVARCSLAEKVRFAVMDGLDDFDEPQCVDVIVSNPPYIRSAECDRLDPRIRDHEPRLALDGGEDGLAFYERYLGDALNLLKPGGAVFFEIGDDQGRQVEDLMGSYGFENVRIERDLAGKDRYASATLR